MARLALLLLFVQVLHSNGQELPTGRAQKNLQRVAEIKDFLLEGFGVNPCRHLLIDCWMAKVNQPREMDSFGLRFNPEDDQNIYLLYRYELKKVNAKTEVGFSVNHFNAVSFRYAHKFAIGGIN